VMSAGNLPKNGPTPRVDSFEIIDFDCTSILTEEEKGWPVSAFLVRVDGFEINESRSNTTQVNPDPRHV